MAEQKTVQAQAPKPPPVVVDDAGSMVQDLVLLGAISSHLARGEPPREVLQRCLSLVCRITGAASAWLLVDGTVIDAMGHSLERSLGQVDLDDSTRLVSQGDIAERIRDWEGSSTPVVSLEGASMVVPCARGGLMLLEPSCGALSDDGRVAMLHALGDLAAGMAQLAAERAVAERRATALELTRGRLREQNLLLRELAVVDELTGLHNRRFFDARLQYELDRFGRYGVSLSLIIFDIDHFKRINDRYGHPAGDEVLKRLAIICKQLVRRVDLLARIGGEEFALLMPNTEEPGAETVAQRLRMRIEQAVLIIAEERLHITVSGGLASVRSGWAGDPAQLFRAADQALYRAKMEGRNRVVVARGTS